MLDLLQTLVAAVRSPLENCRLRALLRNLVGEQPISCHIEVVIVAHWLNIRQTNCRLNGYPKALFQKKIVWADFEPAEGCNFSTNQVRPRMNSEKLSRN
jgi:hypothetical protein